MATIAKEVQETGGSTSARLSVPSSYLEAKDTVCPSRLESHIMFNLIFLLLLSGPIG